MKRYKKKISSEQLMFFKISMILFILFLVMTLMVHAQDAENENNGGDIQLDIEETLSDDIEYLKDQKLKSLKEREAKIAAREIQLDEKEKQLKKLKEEIDKETERLVEIQKKLDKMITQISGESEERISNLVKIYENMKADNAAKVLVELYKRDRETVIMVVKGMQPRKSGKILDSMTTLDEKAAANISYELSKKVEIDLTKFK